jgi:hypothetical protein
VALAEIDLRPVEINGLGDTQTMASHKEHQRGCSSGNAAALSIYGDVF